jgi:hypothetical protein
MPDVILPSGFEDLTDLAVQWGRPDERARSEIRWQASAAEFAGFYNAVMPRLDAILARLASLSFENMGTADKALFDLAAAFAEAAPHHELYKGSADVPFSFSARRFVPGHGDTPSLRL